MHERSVAGRPAYYNEHDPFCAAWLRNLVRAGLIPAGDVDQRSIVDVRPGDLDGYGHCHFFAGLGGWALAARLAGWPDDLELWTGSPPCQPYSVAGRGLGQADPRHLWPEMFRLLRERRPAAVVGEQVAAAVGRAWLDGVLADLEGEGYACGAAVLPACGVGAPHRRERIWFVADADRERLQGPESADAGSGGRRPADTGGVARRALADAGREGLPLAEQSGGHQPPQAGDADAGLGQAAAEPGRRDVGTLVHAARGVGRGKGRPEPELRGGRAASAGAGARSGDPWDGAVWIAGADGKSRRVEPGIRLLAHGIPGRVGRLRAYGNAIVPQLGAAVLAAFLEARRGEPAA